MKAGQNSESLRFFRACLSLLACAVLAACSSTGPVREADTGSRDPLEGLNRAVYKFNDVADEYVIKPVAKGYKYVTPQLVRTGVTHFFFNLGEPLNVVNGLLQGKYEESLSDAGRFLVNTTVGVVGIFDFASDMGLQRHDEDFGQTLGVWGVADGPYVVLPILGPRNLRDAVMLPLNILMNPTTYFEPAAASWGAWSLDLVNTRTRYLGTKDIIEQAAGQDPYIFVREAYRQRRRSDVYDGEPKTLENGAVDELLFEDEPPAPVKKD